ncbi:MULTISPECIES: hypothetical protein [Haloferax]|uniref:Uncharacterized protein n=1 Tax=Haloferax marinum TaxID=2666143 RepID=A0A6A8G6S5_9EURY|nr:MULTISPECIES: hypothetical protein [Haloferax]KAB1197777.1 hypothetical protein Hfx1150_09670 [Haloferax sp. CBA1150]MRW96834.1 hypothetical protein [Haloferax marinum]
MVSLTRREALRLGGVALTGGLAGCTADSKESSQVPRLGELDVLNYDPTPHTVHVVLLDDSEPVYWASEDVPPAKNGELGGAEFVDFPTEPGAYVLHVRADDQPTSEWEQFDFGEYGVDCLGIQIKIGHVDQTAASDVSIWKTTNARVCETADSTE